MTGFWIFIGFIGVVLVLFIIGYITGEVSFEPYSLRRAGMRGGMTLDAMFSGPERQAAIEYVLEDQDKVVLDQERGEGDGEGENDHLVLFQYPEGNGNADAPD